MFGYVRVNKPELKIREFSRYQSFYCGLCQRLKKRHGAAGQLTLTYDMTFLILLLSSVYEPKEIQREKRCVFHFFQKKGICYNSVTDYAADMNILLTQKHFVDDWQDEKKPGAWIASQLYRRKVKQIRKQYSRQWEQIEKQLQILEQKEAEHCGNLDEAARPFGDLMAELFDWKQDGLSPVLREFGFYFGKYIYLLDAYHDREEDEKKDCYNPFRYDTHKVQPDEYAHMVLEHTAKMVIVAFEKLPCQQDLAILRNILYEGMQQSWKGN